MCLSNVKVNVRDLFGRKNRSIIMWKVVSKTDNGFEAVCQYFKYKLNEVNICDRKNKRINKVDDPDFYNYKSIDKGFHFFRNFFDAYRFAGYAEGIVPVICDREDYIAHNKEQAVFMKFRFLYETDNKNMFKKDSTKNYLYYVNRLL